MRQQLDHQRNRLRRSSKTSGGRRVNIIRPRKIRVVLEGLRGEDSTARIAIIAITLEVHDETLSYGWCL
jgi:hypothetical protein